MTLFSVIIFSASAYLLFRRSKQCGKLGFFTLFWLHGIVGVGYVFIAVYETYDLGPAYTFPYSLGPTSSETYWYVLLICLVLLGLNQIWHKFDKGTQSFQLDSIGFLWPEILVIAPVLMIIYVAGVRFGTLSVGLGEVLYALPLRLNGVIEVVTLYIIPFYLALVFQSKKGLVPGLSTVSLYGLFNLTLFSSKLAALFPVVVFASVRFVIRKQAARELFWPLIVMLAAYSFLNMGYIREVLREGAVVSFAEMVSESFEQSSMVSGETRINPLVAFRNIGVRITGARGLDWGIRLTSMRPQPEPFVTNYLERIFGSSGLAVGHFGYFMIATGSSLLGFLLAVGIWGLLLFTAIYFDQTSIRTSDVRMLLIGMTLFLSLMHPLIDGTYDNDSYYLQSAFSMLVIYRLTGKLARKSGAVPAVPVVVLHQKQISHVRDYPTTNEQSSV
ncbi:MAG: hypothetical protein HZC38_09575 [Chloroflexi bacterium]|nr:hypothetical protein [Chloroflexota bacterium]